jgi:hypothetical protein
MTYTVFPEPSSEDQESDPIHVVKKVSNEGSSSPFVARIFINMLEFRNTFINSYPIDRKPIETTDNFNKAINPMYEAAQATRDGGREVLGLLNRHKINLASGRAVRILKNQYDILETIDTPLGQSVDKVITQGIIAIKTGLQRLLLDVFDIDIGFIFQKPKKFNDGIEKLKATSKNDLAEYLVTVRNEWLSDLLELRNQQEHSGWTLTGIKYSLVDGTTVNIELPTVLGVSVEDFARLIPNRILLFIENSLIYAFQEISKNRPINIVEIPHESRDISMPKRFRLTPRGLDPSKPWKITYSDDLDFI